MIPKLPRKIIVNKKFQLRMIALFVAHSIFLSLTFIIVSYVHFEGISNFGEQIALDHKHPLMIWAEEQSAIYTKSLFIAGSIITLISAVFSVALSHKIAGPIYRLTRAMKNAKLKSEKPTIAFRKDDFFHELAEAFNEMNTATEAVPIPDNVVPFKKEHNKKSA
jgi:methyl-accepting chemotaxis protein